MIKRPLCVAALLWAAILWLLGQAGIPGFCYDSPVLPETGETEYITATGEIYKKEIYSLNTNLYLKNANLILNSKKFPVDNIKVKIKNEYIKEEPCAGDLAAVKGKLEEIPLPANPGQFHERAYYYARKVKWFQEAWEFRILKKSQNPVSALQTKIKDRVKAGINSSVGKEKAGILEAMILGDKQNMEQEIPLLFEVMGCSHILAISGLHLSVLGGTFLKILRKTGMPIWASGILSVVVMFFYSGLTGNGAAVVRASIMFSVSTGAVLVKRTYDFLSAASLAAILLLADSPLYLYDSSFLLSFGAILGLGMVYPVLFHKLQDFGKKWGKVRQTIAGGLCSGISVWVLLLPLVMYFFYEVPLWGIFTNLLVLPASGILLISGILCSILGMLPFKFPGQAAGIPAVFILELYIKTGNIVLNIPGALYLTGRPEVWKCMLYYGAFILLLWMIQKRFRYTAAGCLLFFLAAGILVGKMPGKGTEITFLDVGQGDCACIYTESGNCYLVDGGSSSVSKAGKYRILPFLESSGISRVQGIFISHMDEDHVNGIAELLEVIKSGETRVKVSRLFLSKCRETQEQRVELEKLGKQAGCEIVYIEKGTIIKDKETVIECLAPQGEGLESNEGSQVLKVTQGGFHVLFTGDIEERGEKQLVELLQEKQEQYEILKVAHHGSKNSTNIEFLEAIRPKAAVISCGAENRYGHPHKELLERLYAFTDKCFSTSQYGAVTIKIKKDAVYINPYRKTRNQ